MNPIQDNLPLASIFSLFGFAGLGCLVQSDPLVSSAIGLIGGGLVYATGSLVARVSVQVMPQAQPEPKPQTDQQTREPDPDAPAGDGPPGDDHVAPGPDETPPESAGATDSPGPGLNLSDVDASGSNSPAPEPLELDPERIAESADPTPDAPGSLNNPTVPHAANDAPLPVDKEPPGE
jgi:hypothetical protein